MVRGGRHGRRPVRRGLHDGGALPRRQRQHAHRRGVPPGRQRRPPATRCGGPARCASPSGCSASPATPHWRIPEHYDDEWRPQPGYNDDKPRAPVPPVRRDVGHGLEWARLALNLRAALGDERPAGCCRARLLFDAAVAEGWAVDGRPGFVYTVDWDGRRWSGTGCTGWPPRPPPPLRCFTASPARTSTPAGTRRGGTTSTDLPRPRRRLVVARARRDNQPVLVVWSGKPDTYHALPGHPGAAAPGRAVLRHGPGRWAARPLSVGHDVTGSRRPGPPLSALPPGAGRRLR